MNTYVGGNTPHLRAKHETATREPTPMSTARPPRYKAKVAKWDSDSGSDESDEEEVLGERRDRRAVRSAAGRGGRARAWDVRVAGRSGLGGCVCTAGLRSDTVF